MNTIKVNAKIKKPKVFWDTEEKAKLKIKVWELKRGQGLSTLQALLAAQSILPPCRQRKPITISGMDWLTKNPPPDTVKQAVAASTAAISAAAVAQKAVDELPQAVGAVAADVIKREIVAPALGQPIRVVVEVNQQAATTSETGDSGVKLMLQELPDRVASAVVKALVDSELTLVLMELTESIKTLSAVNHNSDVQTTGKAPVVKVKLPLVVLCNLLPVQWQEIKKEFDSVFDLRLWDGKKGNVKQLRSLVLNSYKVFAASDYIAHSDDAMLSKLAGNRYVRYTGSISTLKTCLRQAQVNAATVMNNNEVTK